MKICLVGAQSAFAQLLRPMLETFAEVRTAGRFGCDTELDLTWPAENIQFPRGFDVVINTAAHFGGRDIGHQVEAVEVNACGALKLCHAAQDAGVNHFVNLSTINATLDSVSPYYDAYAITKRQGDELIELYCKQHGIVFTLLRPSQLYGPQTFRKHQIFLYNAVDNAVAGEDIVIHGSRAPWRNYIFAEDLAKVVIAVVRKRIGGVYQCASNVDTSFMQIADLAIGAARSRSLVHFDTSKSDLPDNVFPYEDAVYKAVGFYPQTNISDGISTLVAARQPRK